MRSQRVGGARSGRGSAWLVLAELAHRSTSPRGSAGGDPVPHQPLHRERGRAGEQHADQVDPQLRRRPSPASPQSPQARQTAKVPTAGIVVTEMNTPTSGPDFAVVSDSVPATPARQATTKDQPSGRTMKSVWVAGAGLAAG